MFTIAKPIFLEGMSKRPNTQARFTARITASDECVLRIAGATIFKVHLDGKLIHHGPSPAARGYFRVDEVSLGRGLSDAVLDVEVAGYYDESYCFVKAESFICAEVVSDGECIAATGRDFCGYLVESREQKVTRYSRQRHFSEVWDLRRADREMAVEVLEMSHTYLPRSAPLPVIIHNPMSECYCVGGFTVDEKSLEQGIDPLTEKLNIRGFELSEITERPSMLYSALRYKAERAVVPMPGLIRAGEYALFELPRNTTGIFDLRFNASAGTKLMIVFEERLYGNHVLDEVCWVNNIISVTADGECRFESFDIYGYKYFAIFVLEGELSPISVDAVVIKNDVQSIPALNTDDRELLDIYDAAVETYLDNSLGVFMDCPTRERAGWLCDSYFTAQTEYALTGKTDVENDFLDNYARATSDGLPEGMLPMCYPANIMWEKHIPQWTLWLILELRDHKRRNPDADMQKFLPVLDRLLGYFSRYENELGLLEDLSGWNFVEWSKANDWTEGINFPSNMLYAEALDVMAELYGRNDLAEKAEAIRSRVLEMCYDGRYFHDQALRDESGKPVVNGNISEACQYYAFRFGVAVGERFEALKQSLINEFTPDGVVEGIERANALMGLYMRMELLLEWGERDRLVSEIRSFYGPMARASGTLWEHKSGKNSLNHGFASFVAVPLLDIFGKK